MLQQRLQMTLEGAVQGVGFRPFIYRLAMDLGLVGWVQNSSQGVYLEVEGAPSQLERFLERLEPEKPPRSQIQSLHTALLDPIGYAGFEIRASTDGAKTAPVLPDIATCPDCLQEIFDPANRRYRYPFTNCTNCGPRFSIVNTLPYDRPHTTMGPFGMCAACQAEYENPSDRRFHAQANACPHCGPHLEFWNREGQVLSSQDGALQRAAVAIRQGQIVAVKGVGGFHLLVDASCEAAVQKLRQVKQRPAKPLALMYPSLEWVKAHCDVSELEERLLRSPAAPIVLLRRKQGAGPVCPMSRLPTHAVAPGNPNLGIMLPYTPLHHLLMHDLGFPVVATSGNLSDEPLCADEHEAIQRLRDIADVFLIHDRSIARPVDDAIVRVVMDQPMMLRCGRGYAPLSIPLSSAYDSDGFCERVEFACAKHTQTQSFKNSSEDCSPIPPVLAVGAHLKNTIALSIHQQVLLSQPIGDLETVPATAAFQQTLTHFQALYDQQPTAIACDLHPDYYPTQFAQQMGVPVIAVQHHYAHALSCMAEHHLDAPVLAIAWDGTGYGLDGTIWGGEFLHITERSFHRVAHLRTFRLPGGSQAIKEPRRAALGLLYELFGDQGFDMKIAPVQTFSAQALRILKPMLKNGLNSPLTSSAGRLFDAIAAILGLRQYTQFEGQAAMELEFAGETFATDASYGFEIPESANPDPALPITIDWTAMVKEILAEQDAGLPMGQLSAKFHNTLVEIMVAIAKQVTEERVILTGGCFQNKLLTERAIQRLRAAGFHPYWHQNIPPHDGGIALGQIMAALR